VGKKKKTEKGVEFNVFSWWERVGSILADQQREE